MECGKWRDSSGEWTEGGGSAEEIVIGLCLSGVIYDSADLYGRVTITG